MNNEWMFGKNRRGCEGIFPISYVDIRVPLQSSQVEPDSGTASRSESVSPAVEGHRVNVLYTFNAETADDLTIVVSFLFN
jgi:SH3 domain-containing protein 19